jgi:hypothetical protein
MKISGRKTDSMERRYNIIDTDDISVAKVQIEARVREPRGLQTGREGEGVRPLCGEWPPAQRGHSGLGAQHKIMGIIVGTAIKKKGRSFLTDPR